MTIPTTIFWTAIHIFSLLSDAAPVFAREKLFSPEYLNESLPTPSRDTSDRSSGAVLTTNSQKHLSGDAASLLERSRVGSQGSEALVKGDFWLEIERKIGQVDLTASGGADTEATTACLSENRDSDNKQEKQQQESISQKAGFPSKMEGQPAIHEVELNLGNNKDMTYGHESHPFYGVVLAVIAAFFVGTSFIFQKKALIKIDMKKERTTFIRSGALGEFAYLKQWMWWCGTLSMAFGEVLNFVAYSVAPAILVTPLGALRVIVSAVLSSIFLSETLNVHGKIGVLLSLIGSVMIVIHAPRHEKVTTFEQVLDHFTDTTFLFYCTVLVALTIFLIVHVAPRRGRTNIMVYITVCNIVGALCVLCGKGIGISIKEIKLKGEFIYLHPVFWILILANVVGIVTQIVYLNKALALFDASKITPIKYVFTNIFLIFGSILLFQEFAYLSIEDVLGMSCGFMTVVTGVVLLNLFKDVIDVIPAKR